MKQRHFILDFFQLLGTIMIILGLGSSIALAEETRYPDMPVYEPTTNFPFKSDFAPAVNKETPSSIAPQIAEWTRQNQPGDTMVLTGEALSALTGDEEGRDTRFIIYGKGFPETDGLIQRLDGQQCAVTLPETLPPNEMYLMWPYNAHGFGLPVAINRTEAWWVGFDKICPGEEFYVYGRSLALGGGKCHLFYTNDDGTLSGWLTSTHTNPYKAAFEMPADVAPGTYTIYAHNGYGGKYGWSDPLELVVQDAFVWEGTNYYVKDFGADGSDTNDDTTAILTAAIAAKSSGSTLIFEKGTYYMTSPLPFYRDTKYVGAGMDSTTITTHSSATNNPLVGMFAGVAYNVEVRDLTFLANEYSALTGPSVQFGYMSDNLYENVRVSNLGTPYEQARNQGPIETRNGIRLHFKNCEFNQSAIANIANLKSGRFDGCTFIGREDCNQFTSIAGAQRLDFSNCLVKNHDPSDSSDGAGWAKGRWITMFSSMRDLYVGNNVTTNVGPRQPTPFIGPDAVLSVGAPQNQENVPNFGEYYEQELLVDYDIPDSMHDMTTPGAQWAGQHAVSEWVIGGETKRSQTYVKYIDATNNVITVMKPSWSSAYPQTYDSYTLSIKDIVDGNSGEIILYEGVASRLSMSPVSATATSMVFTDTAAVNDVNGSKANVFSIVAGKGLGQSRRASKMDVATGTVYVDRPFNVIPDETSVLNFGVFADHVLVYDNTFDGRMEVVTNTTASTCLNIYGNGKDIIFANNEIHEVRNGTYFFAEGYRGYYPGVSARSGSMFSHIEANRYRSGFSAVAMSERLNTANPSNNDGVRHLGHMIRNNTMTDMFHDVVKMKVMSTVVNPPYQMNVFQDNTFSNFRGNSITEDQGVANTVWIDNTFYGSPGQTGYTIAANHVPVLRGNRWKNFDPKSEYGGNRPGPRIGLPIRYPELNRDASKVEIPVWNSGTDLMDWDVTKLTDAAWLSVSTSNTTGVSETDAGNIALSVLQPWPTEDSEVILSVSSDGVNSQQVTVSYSAQSATISISRTTYSVPVGEFWVQVVDQDTQARRDLGLWYGPCHIPIENMPEAATIIIKKKNAAATAWDLYEEIGTGNRPG